VRDLIANSSGTVLGVVFALVLTAWRIVRREPVRTRVET